MPLDNLINNKSVETKPTVPEQKFVKTRAQEIVEKTNKDLAKIKPNKQAIAQEVSGKNINFSKYDQNLDKLKSYSGLYKEYGYNPYVKDNVKFYDDNTSDLAQYGRALYGMGKLATHAFKTEALFGAFDYNNSHEDFADINDTYSTQRGGFNGFMQNMLVSSGYTVGLVADMVVEDALLAAATAATFGASAPVTGTALVAKTGSTIKALGKLWNGFSDLKKITSAAQTVEKLSTGKKVLNFLNPLTNTTDFVKSLKTIDDVRKVNNTTKIALGTGALFRDAKAAYGTFSESRLEANMTRDEVLKDLVDNHQGVISSDQMAAYNKQADDAYKYTLNSNLAVIGLTNNIVFDNMYKKIDASRNAVRTFGQSPVGEIIGSGGNFRAVKKGFYGLNSAFAKGKLAFKGGFVNSAKNIAKGAAKYSTNNLTEGLQEFGQEVVATASKHNFGSEAEGNYFESVLDGMKSQFTHQGLETFMSGFLMGGMVSPVTGGITKSFDYVTTGVKGGFKNRKERFAQLEEDAAVINSVYQNAGNIFNNKAKTFSEQADLKQEMDEAAKNNDKKTFENKKAESYRKHLKTVMKHGMMDDFVGHLESFKGMTPQEFNQAFPETEETMSQQDVIESLDKKIAKARDFEYMSKNIDRLMPNPIDLKKLNKDDADYMHKVNAHYMFEKSKEEVLFARAEIADNLGRKEDLIKAVHEDLDANGVSYGEYQKLFSPESMTKEKTLLQNEISALQEVTDAESKATLKNKKAKLEALTAYSDHLEEMSSSLDRMQELKEQDSLSPKEKKELKKLSTREKVLKHQLKNKHHAYLKALDGKSGKTFDKMSDESFDKLYDYYSLDNANKHLDDTVNTLLDPDTALDTAYRMASVENFKKMKVQHDEYVKNSLALVRDKQAVEDTVGDLFEKGVAVAEDDLDEMRQSGTLPEVVYDLETGEVLDKEDPRYEEAQTELSELKDSLLIPFSEAEEVDVNDDFKNFPVELQQMLIDEYISQMEKGDVKKEDVSNLTVTNTTPRFDRWVDDNAEALINKYNERFPKVENTFSQLSNDQKESLVELGYDNAEEVNKLSVDEVKEVIENEKEQEPVVEEESPAEQKPVVEETPEIKPEIKTKALTKEDVGVLVMGNTAGLNEMYSNNYDEALGKPEDARMTGKSSEYLHTIKVVDGNTVIDISVPFSDFTGRGGFMTFRFVVKNGKTVDTQKLIDAVNGIHQILGGSIDAKSDKKIIDNLIKSIVDIATTTIVNDVVEQPDVKPKEEPTEQPAQEVDEFDRILQERSDAESRDYKVAAKLLKLAEEASEYLGEGNPFFYLISKAMDLYSNSLGKEVSGVTITPEILIELYKQLEATANAIGGENNTSLLSMFKIPVQNQVNDKANEQVVKQKKQTVKKEVREMLALGFLLEDLDVMSKKEIKEIRDNKTTKQDYLNSKAPAQKANEDAQVEAVFALLPTTIRTQKELTREIGKLSVAHSELFDRNPETVALLANIAKEQLEVLTGFSNLKKGDVVLFNGSLKKVVAVSKDSVNLIEYNKIIENKITLSPIEFDSAETLIVNEFNKNKESVSVEMDQTNVEDLSKLLRNFTNVLSEEASNDAPADEELSEHFKTCK